MKKFVIASVLHSLFKNWIISEFRSELLIAYSAIIIGINSLNYFLNFIISKP